MSWIAYDLARSALVLIADVFASDFGSHGAPRVIRCALCRWPFSRELRSEGRVWTNDGVCPECVDSSTACADRIKEGLAPREATMVADRRWTWRASTRVNISLDTPRSRE